MAGRQLPAKKQLLFNMLYKNNASFSSVFGIVAKDMKFERLAPHIEAAEEQYIVTVLGTTQYAALNSAVANDNATTEQTKLIDKCRQVIRSMALYIGFPKLHLTVSNSGIHKADSEDYEQVSGSELYYARIQYLLDGYKFVDGLYKFLEDNSADYPMWTSSAEYLYYKSFFISNAKDFSKHTGAVENRWLLIRLYAQMEIAEQLYVSKAIGAAFLKDLKVKFSAGNTTAEEKTLIAMLLKPIALYTYSSALIDPGVQQLLRVINAASADDLSNKGQQSETYKTEYQLLASQKEKEAIAFMQLVKEYLNATASDTVFPLYYTSSYYSNPVRNPATKLPNYNNDSSETSFVMI